MAFFPDISELSPEKTTVTLIYSPRQILVCVLNCPWNDAVIVEDKSVCALTLTALT